MLTLQAQFLAFVYLLVSSCLVFGLDLTQLPKKQGLPIRAVNLDGRELAKRAAASIGQAQLGHSSYYVTISLGEINLRVALDTGSADLWVLSTGCISAFCHSLPSYPLSFNSPSFSAVNNNQTAFKITYADSTSAAGIVARENVTLYNITSPNQAFALVNGLTVPLTDKISGVLGLGFSRLSSISRSTPNATSFIRSLAQSGTLTYPIFGLSLTNSNNGSLTLGAVDSSVVNDTRQIVWHPVVPFAPDNQNDTGSQVAATHIQTDSSAIYLHWALQLVGITANGQGIQPIPSYPGTSQTSLALLDAGASGIYGPYQDVARLFAALHPDSRLVSVGQWALPCSTTATIAFTFGSPNQTVILQPQDYIIGEAEGNPDLCLAWPQALTPNNVGVDWQFGGPFLRKVYSVFSYGIDGKEPPMIGLMPLSASFSAPSSTGTGSVTSTTSGGSSTSSGMPALVTSTIITTLPNFPLPTTTSPLTTSYALNTSAGIPSIGSHPTADLAVSTYKPILGSSNYNASAIPTIAPNVSKQTFIITDSAGRTLTETSTSLIPAPSVPLGVPPGVGAAASHRIGLRILGFESFSWTLICILLINLAFSDCVV